MDNLLNAMFDVFAKLLPFIRCLALIALIVLMHKIILYYCPPEAVSRIFSGLFSPAPCRH